MKNHLTKYWLMMGVVALAIAGLYSLTLVIGRAPVFSENLEIQRIFKDALVVHVNLSVLVWFLAVACIFLSIAHGDRRGMLPYVEEASLICFGLCILCMMASPFLPGATPYMSNYIPTISHPMFMLSLGFLLSGVGLMVCRQLLVGSWQLAEHSVALITLIALACFFWSYHLMPPVIEGEQYYDLLFWGGGHVLQLTHGVVVMMVWYLVMSSVAETSLLRNDPSTALGMTMKWLYAAMLLLALISPAAYFLYDITSSEFRTFFTHGIMTLGGLPPAMIALYVLWQCAKQRRSPRNALWSSALVSSLLFLYGGFLALLIQGENVMIPAHYHGSIVGITIAFMGFAYYLLPQLGYKPVAQFSLAFWQPIILGIGQFMHISGLAYSGGYGVLRKTAGGVGELAPNIKIALGFMGLGGVLAIAGGLIFIIVMMRGFRH